MGRASSRGEEARRQWLLLVVLARTAHGEESDELAERFGVSPRTIRRDLTALGRALGVHVVRRRAGRARLYALAAVDCPLCGLPRRHTAPVVEPRGRSGREIVERPGYSREALAEAERRYEAGEPLTSLMDLLGVRDASVVAAALRSRGVVIRRRGRPRRTRPSGARRGGP